MKKIYVTPITIQYQIMGNQVLLSGSFKEGLGTTGVDGGSALSRDSSGSLWDDEEE